ncbi:hypothetical protein ACFXJ8_06305 [Nonomuraea sp. NPDC059194]|uniref:hypothetical protein n=1 Tax=Nonomuraea sp. NPDC059194 TaxID=3346764 RepID=UPI003698C94A
MSALLLSLGISGGVVLAAVPLISHAASASIVVRDPGDVVPPCDAGQNCEPTEVVTTVTITSTLPTPTPTDPVTTVTTTVTPKATKTTKAPEPEQPTTKPPTTQAPPVQPPPVVPSTDVSVPQTTPETSDPAPTFSFPSVQETPSQETPTADTTTSSSESEELVVRNAAPEYDQVQLSRKLGIPALVLVLLALFAVLIFEGRLRRLAHAAAVRRAGPQGPGRHRGDPVPEPYGYPAGPGFAGPVPAYAPIISFVPVQTYPGGPAQYAPVYQQPFPQDPSMYGQAGPTADYPTYAPPGYPQPGYPQPGHPHQEYVQPEYVQPEDMGGQDQPPGEFNAFQPREFQVAGDDPLPPDVVSGQAQYRDLFEPLVPPDQPALGDIPPGGDAPYDDRHHSGHGGGVPSVSETGDAEPWKLDDATPEPNAAEPGRPDDAALEVGSWFDDAASGAGAAEPGRFDDAAPVDDGTMILPLREDEDRDRREF